MKIHKNTYGFTLVETLIGILMTTIICSTLFLGVTQAKLYLESIRIKEKAFLELKNFTNEWKSMVAAGVSNFPSDANSGKSVPLQVDKNGNTTLEGNLYKKISQSLTIDNSKSSKLLNWHPPVSTKNALKRVAKDFIK